LKKIPFVIKYVNFKVAITEMYPWIPWEQLVADFLGPVEHTSGNTALNDQNHVSSLDKWEKKSLTQETKRD